MTKESSEMSRRGVEVISDYKSRVARAVSILDSNAVLGLVDALQKTRSVGGVVFVAGNGGSASTAGHIVVDWMLGTQLSNPPLRVVSISEGTAAITATGNDVDFESIFSRQFSVLATEQDLLVVISASGNSPNLLRVASDAKVRGIPVCAITGFNGGQLRSMADISVHVSTEMGDYGVAEDAHLMLGHIVKEVLIAEESHA